MWIQIKNCKNHAGTSPSSNNLNCFIMLQVQHLETNKLKIKVLFLFIYSMGQGAVWTDESSVCDGKCASLNLAFSHLPEFGLYGSNQLKNIAVSINLRNLLVMSKTVRLSSFYTLWTGDIMNLHFLLNGYCVVVIHPDSFLTPIGLPGLHFNAMCKSSLLSFPVKEWLAYLRSGRKYILT